MTSKNSIKYKLSVISFLCLTGITLIITTCTKDEDSAKLRKEAMTLALNNDINADTLKSIVIWMQGMGTRFALSDRRRNVAMKIKNRYIGMGYADTRIDSFLIKKTYQAINYQQWQYNIIATLKGSIYPDSICIIGGHYDNNLTTGDPFSIIPGANDNASGVAAALEIARVMKKNNFSPRNTIEFIAFGSEELGLFGSYAYISDFKQSSKKLKMMLNNDMIAYQPGINQSEWWVNIIDYENSRGLRTEAEHLCSSFTVLKFINDNTYNKQSDSYSFFTNGYKAIYFASAWADPNIHTINDVVSNCNFEYCREIVKMNCDLLVNNN